MTAGGPVFVGGTGRSGTTIVSKLIASHPSFARIPIEVRFLTDRHGLCAVLEGRSDLKQFARRVRGPWWQRIGPRDQPRGLHLILSEELLADALARLLADFESDPHGSSRTFVSSLLDPIAAEQGANHWVEDTPPNIQNAATLLEIMPTARLVHSVRDGRDVACSVARLPWGPNTLSEALAWWAEMMQSGHSATARCSTSWA